MLIRTLREDNIRFGSVPFATMYISELELLKLSTKYFPHSVPLKPLLRLMRSGSYFDLSPKQKPLVSLPPISGQPSIALLVVTIGRVAELDRLLVSLEGQSYKNFQILLADQNPEGYLDDVLARHSSLPITRIVLPPQGVSICRNVLLEQAKADIIVFPDDDCWYAPDTLECVCKMFVANPACGALLGVWTPSPDIYAPRVSEGIVSRMGLFQSAETYVQFYRREAVTGIHFDPLLGPGTGLPYGCGEDTDYLLYVHARTEVRRYANIRVFHPSPIEQMPSPQKIVDYAAGRMYLLRKHGFSWLFKLFNVLYPLCMAPLDTLRYGKGHGVYRLRMFVGRLRNLWHLHETSKTSQTVHIRSKL